MLPLCQPANFLEVVGLATTVLCLAICRELSLGVHCTTILTVLNHLILNMPSIVTFLCILSHRVRFLVFFILFSTSFCALWVSTLRVYVNIWSLVALLMFLMLLVQLLVLLVLTMCCFCMQSAHPFLGRLMTLSF